MTLQFLTNRLSFVLATSFFLSSSLVAQENWPEFRGPTADGKFTSAKIPTGISENNLEWETPIHGKGWSSPVIWGNQVWLTTATVDGKKMSALCVDLETGKVLLDRVIHENAEPDFAHETNSYASPTPAIEDGKVYLHFGKYGTTCLDTKTFEQLWQRTDFECDHFRGPAASPIIFEDLLIVAFDGADVQYVVGLDKKTGNTVWKTNRDINYGTDVGDKMKAYCTGAIFEVDGQPLLIYPSAVATGAYDPRSGKEIWKIYHDGMNASARPVQAENGRVILTNGMGLMVAINPSGAGDITESNIAWKNKKNVARKSSQVLIDGSIFMNGDKGIISCVDLESGRTLWQERVGGNFAASPVYDGTHLMSISEQGTIHVYKPSRENYVEVAKMKFGDGFKASPAASGDRMILRSFSKLHCIKNEAVERSTSN